MCYQGDIGVLVCYQGDIGVLVCYQGDIGPILAHSWCTHPRIAQLVDGHPPALLLPRQLIQLPDDFTVLVKQLSAFRWEGKSGLCDVMVTSVIRRPKSVCLIFHYHTSHLFFLKSPKPLDSMPTATCT